MKKDRLLCKIQVKEEKTMKISEAIKEMIKLRGLSIFDNYKIFIAMLADFSTDTNSKELSIFKKAVDDKILKICSDNNLKDNNKIAKIRMRLEDDGFAEHTINFVIESFALPLGWNYTLKQTMEQTQQTKQVQTKPANNTDWTCSCGTVNSGNFCGNCGASKPTPQNIDWTCSCGTVNKTNFCTNCGKQSEQQSISPVSNPFTNAKIADYVKFGNYPQTANGDILPIEWQILARKKNKMLLISKYGLEAMRFNSSFNYWGTSEIRTWLNSFFYYKAFNKNEKKYITPVGGDSVFLLSKYEAEEYFANNEARMCKPTDYAMVNGAYVNNDYCLWWLCSPAPDDDSNHVYDVGSGGGIRHCLVKYDDVVVRPALWVNL